MISSQPPTGTDASTVPVKPVQYGALGCLIGIEAGALLLVMLASIGITTFVQSEWIITCVFVLGVILLCGWIVIFCRKLHTRDQRKAAIGQSARGTQHSQEDQPAKNAALWSPSADQIRAISLGVFGIAVLIIWTVLLYEPSVDIRERANIKRRSLPSGLSHTITISYPEKLRYSRDLKDVQRITVEYSQQISPTATIITLVAEPPGSFVVLDTELKTAQSQISLLPGQTVGQVVRLIQPTIRDDMLGQPIRMIIRIEDDALSPPMPDKAIPLVIEPSLERTAHIINSHALGDIGLVFGAVLTVIGLMLELRKSAKDSIETEEKSAQEKIAAEENARKQHIEYDHNQRIEEVKQSIPKDPFTAIEQLEKCRQDDTLKQAMSKEIDRIEESINRALTNKEIARMVLREVGRRLRESRDNEDRIRILFKAYNFPKIKIVQPDEDQKATQPDKEEKLILPNKIDTDFVLTVFKEYGEDSRDLCVHLINGHKLRITDKKIPQAGVIFLDRDVVNDSNDLRLQSEQEKTNNNTLPDHIKQDLEILDELSETLNQRRIPGFKQSIKRIEDTIMLSLGIDVTTKDHQNIPVNLQNDTSLDLESLALLVESKHIMLIDSLLCWTSFDSIICDTQKKAQHSTWSVCVNPGSIPRFDTHALIVRDILQDIVWAIAETWLDLLAERPMAIFVLTSDAQIELVRLLRRRITTSEMLRLELEGRGSPQFSTQYAEIHRRFMASYSTSTPGPAPDLQDYIGWLRLRPYGCKNTWLWVIQSPPNEEYMRALQQIERLLEDANTWLRIVLPERSATMSSMQWVVEPSNVLERRFESVFSRITGNAFASFFRDDSEAKLALATIVRHADGSFRRALKLFYDVYLRTAERPTRRSIGRLQAKDFDE